MSYVEIEVRAKTVDLAVEAAMQELGVDDRDELSVTVVQEPERGFLGMGGTDAIVQVKRVKPRNRRRDRGKREGGSSQSQSRGRDGGNRRSSTSGNGQQRSQRQPQKTKGNKGRDMSRNNRPDNKEDDRDDLSIDRQKEIVEEFLTGLVDVYGLEGEVVTSIEDEVIVADIRGEQTEALIGVRGSVRSAIHELTRTVLQRYASDSARLRLDIAGYAERRREALTIYANQLIEQLEADGGELMLEPMSSADRKVIHDAAAASQSVSSYSEGEPPRRYVVLARVDESATSESDDPAREEE